MFVVFYVETLYIFFIGFSPECLCFWYYCKWFLCMVFYFVCCQYCMVALKQVNKFFYTLPKGWSLIAFFFKMVDLSGFLCVFFFNK